MIEIKADFDWIRDNPEYLDILTQLIQYERNLEPADEDDSILNRHEEKTGRSHDVRWRSSDTPFPGIKLYHLENHGFLDRVFDTNSTTAYSILNREEIAPRLEEISNQFNEGTRTVIHDFPSEEELEEKGIFDDVVGYEDIKFLMRRAMSEEEIVNIIMIGPPGSAKTVFLMCINKLDDSCFISGKSTSGPGFFDEMFDQEPRYMAIDELDNMSGDSQKALSDYTDTGILVETKGNDKRRKMRTNTKTFAAANRSSDILDEIENRFIDLHFEPYSHDEFMEVCEHILPRNEGKSEREATKIAQAVWETEGYGNVRKAIQAARLSKGDPEKVVGILDNYSDSGLTGL